jgi:hypothetical protein
MITTLNEHNCQTKLELKYNNCNVWRIYFHQGPYSLYI